MFSSNELLQFVFADGNDVYYCNELLALDLHQFLWLKLHEQGYGCVYFLELAGECPVLKSYGDRRAQSYVLEKAKLWPFSKQRSRNYSLRKWLWKVLCEKGGDSAAIVCDLREFCDYFSDEDRLELLRELAALDRRTGSLILTAPPEAEASRSLFLSSPVFEALGESSITELREAGPCDLYAAMHRSKPDRMIWLNAFTKERIHSLLTRMLLEDAKRTVDCDLLPEMEDFLLQWMNNPALRALEPQLEKRMPVPDGRFQSAYDRLRREESWSQLAAKASQILKSGGIQGYAETLDCALAEDPVGAVCVRRDPDSYAGRCLNLRIRAAGCAETERAEIDRLLAEIRRQLRAPRNREENPKMTEAVNSLLQEIYSADFDGDAGTVRRILFSVNFCIQWICVPAGSPQEADILTVLEKLRGYISCSRLYHERQRSYGLIRSEHSGGGNKLTALAMRQLEEQAETAKRVLGTYEDVVQAAILQLSVASGASVSELVRRLSEELNQQNEAALSKLSEDWTPERSEEQEAPAAEPEPEPAAEEEEYVLTDEDYSIQPLSKR